MDNGRLIALGLLASFGYGGGFVLSTIASPHLDLKAPPRAAPAAGNGQGQASGTIGGGGRGAGSPAAGGGGGGGGGSGGGGGAASAGAAGAAGGAGQGAEGGSGNGAAASAAAARTGAAGDSGGRDAKAQDAGARAGDAGTAGAGRSGAAAGLAGPAQPCAFVALTGAKAAAFLAGNSVNDAGESLGGATLGYFAPRGLWASFGRTSIAVRPWDPKGEALCQPKPGAPQAVVCIPLRVRQCSGEGAGTPTIGYLMLHEGRWSPVYRGNVQRFPDHIPVLDPPRHASTAVHRERRGGALRAASTVLDRDSAYRRSDARPDGRDQVFVFAADGRRLDFRMPADDHPREVLIRTGWWSLAKGILCQGTSRDHADCATPKPGSGGRVALLPVDAGSPSVELLAVAAPDQRAAADD